MILEQLVKFGLVGACGALVDWGLFNWLTSGRRKWDRIAASVGSTSCAMVWSFTANFILVFHPAESATIARMGKFLLVTCFSGWGLQSFVIWAVSACLFRPERECGVNASRTIFGRITLEFFEKNLEKIMAIAAGFVWNFCWYRCWVYAA